jgi:excinuclease ABC subunit C
MLLQRIRDEAHRFAITFHRQVRSKKALNSQLTDIEGIGALTAQKLLKEFKSVKKIQMASEEDIAAVIGAAKAKALLAELAKNKASN